MRDKWGINAWFNPIWFLIYLRRMIRDADFQRELAEPGAYYDVTGPFRTLFAKLRR
jgi:hypothetical protein